MSLRDHLWHILNDPKDRRYHWFLGFIVVLILASFAMLTYEVLGEPGPRLHRRLEVIDDVILGIFLVEYVARLAVIRNWRPDILEPTPGRTIKYFVLSRLRFMTSFWGLIDLVSLMPLFGLRSFRILRLMRLFRGARVFRYASPVRTLMSAVRDNALLFAVSTALVIGAIVLSAVMLFFAEFGENPQIDGISDTLWWSIVTISTVGFGDITPTTSGGRVIGAMLMLSGMFVIALFAGVISSTLVGHLLPLRMEQVRMSSISDHIVIAGWNDDVPMLIDQMSTEYGDALPKIIVMAPIARPESLDEEVRFIHGDPTKEREYDKVRLAFARTVVVVGDKATNPAAAPQARDAQTVLTIFTLRSIERHFAVKRRRPLHICAEILDPENISHAQIAGGDDIIASALMGYSMLSHVTGNPGTATALGTLVLASGQNVYTSAMPVELMEGELLEFHQVQQRARDRFGALVVGVVHHERMKINPPTSTPVYNGDELVYIASKPFP